MMGMNKKENESGAKIESLPSRTEYHRSRHKKKGKVKISVPLILVVVLLLLPVAILAIINGSDKSNADRVNSSSGEEVLFETDEAKSSKDTEKEVSEKEPKQEVEKENTAQQKEESTEVKEQEPPPKQEVKQEVPVKEEPKKEEPIKQTPKKETTPSNNEQAQQGQDGVIYHQVQPGETLFRIAMNYYKSQQGVDKIKQANGLSSNEISVGQTLKIPKP